MRVIQGSVFDVAVDLRANSRTYGQWYGVELTEENGKQFYISEGFAHGFLVLSEVAKFCYKTTDFYHPGDEAAWHGMILKLVLYGRSLSVNIKEMHPLTAINSWMELS